MKKLVSMFTLCIMLFAMSIMPVAAADFVPASSPAEVEGTSQIALLASNYFSGSTGKMNAWGGQSGIFNISSGSVPDAAEVSGVSLNVTVSSGSMPFYIVVEDPYGNSAQSYVLKSGPVSFTQFNGLYPKGTWKVYIYNTSGVSTATARMTVNYTY